MDLESIKKYFNEKVKTYQPYKDVLEYRLLMDTVIENHYNTIYQSIPNPFSKAFEHQILPVEFHDKLLLSIGFPLELISKFTQKDKEILIQSFMDYNKFKGTISQFNKIGEKFGENVGIYELLINKNTLLVDNYSYTIQDNRIVAINHIALSAIRQYDKIRIGGQLYNVENIDTSTLTIHLDSSTSILNQTLNELEVVRWVFIPKPVYVSKTVNLIETPLPYDEVYNKTPRFFISPIELDTLDKNDSLILPVKSNLILLDYYKYDQIVDIYNLFSTIFLKEYYNERLTIYFKDGEYSITLGRIYKVWYYLIFLYYGVDLSKITSDTKSISYYVNSPDLTYTIDDIPKILDEYRNIESTPDYGRFYYEYVESKIEQKILQSKSTLSDFKELIRLDVGDDLIEYIDNRTEYNKLEFYFILDEIYNSLVTWSILSNDSDIIANIDYLLNNLTKLNYSIDLSPTYHLINFVKPYHTDLVESIQSFLQVKDIANSAIVESDTFNQFNTTMHSASNLTQYDIYQHLIALSPIDMTLVMSTFRNELLTNSTNDLLVINNQINPNISLSPESVVFVTDAVKAFINEQYNTSTTSLITEHLLCLTKVVDQIIKLNYDFTHAIEIYNDTALVVNTKYLFERDDHTEYTNVSNMINFIQLICVTRIINAIVQSKAIDFETEHSLDMTIGILHQNRFIGYEIEHSDGITLNCFNILIYDETKFLDVILNSNIKFYLNTFDDDTSSAIYHHPDFKLRLFDDDSSCGVYCDAIFEQSKMTQTVSLVNDYFLI